MVEVYTPGGSWSSYPPHKHDIHKTDAEGNLLEADLEEIYYYKLDRPEGYAFQRVYTDPESPLHRKVLPVSGNDDQIRRATYRAIYGNSTLAPYSMRAVPPIHIIVDNGHVTLEGVVARQMDKQIAEMQAKSVPGVFSVDDNLRVEEDK